MWLVVDLLAADCWSWLLVAAALSWQVVKHQWVMWVTWPRWWQTRRQQEQQAVMLMRLLTGAAGVG